MVATYVEDRTEKHATGFRTYLSTYLSTAIFLSSGFQPEMGRT
jgi:hypothetical protein